MITEHGLDISKYQCQFYASKWHYPDFRKPAALGITWVKIRLAVGDYYIDPTFQAMYAGYKSTGLYPDGVAPYIVFAPNRYQGGALIPAAPQVDYALDAFTRMGFTLDGAAWTGDYEINRGATRAQISPRITQYLARMKQLTLSPVVYTRASWWDVYTARGTGTGYPLHVAHYTGDYTIDPLLPQDWKGIQLDQLEYQYSADGNMKGKEYGMLSPSVDLNVRFVYQDAPPPPPPPEPIMAEALGDLNIRTGPGVQYASVGYLKKGQVVEVLERKVTGEWARHDKGWSVWQTETKQWMQEVGKDLT